MNMGARHIESMYKIVCNTCGNVGFHPSRIGAESRADIHIDETGHDSHIEPMTETELSG